MVVRGSVHCTCKMELEKSLPPISYSGFASARIAEIKSILKQLDDADHGRRSYQNLPRHMQRRQCSTNPKRLPKNLREQHRREGGNNAKKTKRPSRKYRRRPSNLLGEYNRRQNDHVWLETHIWHAKRFHMIKRFGYCLPDFSACKGFRAAIRAAKNTCLVQDVSYLNCIQLKGSVETIFSGLNLMILPADLAALSQLRSLGGQNWAVVTFYSPHKKPYGALGPADVMLLPSDHLTSKDSKSLRLWVWVHPSAHSHLLNAFIGVFDFKKLEDSTCTLHCVDESDEPKNMSGENTVASELNTPVYNIASEINTPTYTFASKINTPVNTVASEINMPASTVASESNSLENAKNNKRKYKFHDPLESRKKMKNANDMKFALKNIPFQRTSIYANLSRDLEMTLLKDTLCRFSLTGPASFRVLQRAFIPASLTDNESVNEENYNFWWKNYYSLEEQLGHHQRQTDAWNKMTDCQPQERIVLPITVRDPRVTLPSKKFPLQEKGIGKETVLPRCPPQSPLYVNNIRDKISLNKEPDYKINEKRSRLLVPGSKLPESPQEAKLPLVLLSRPPTHSLGYGVGWDVVTCSGWGMNVWLPIIMCGGVAGGQQAAESLYMEFLTPMAPNLHPDTPSGGSYSEFMAKKKHVKYFKRPPNCRPNYIKLGVQFPFTPPWQKLINSWVCAQDIYVLRDPNRLEELANRCGDAFNSLKRTVLKRIKDDLKIDPDKESVDLVLKGSEMDVTKSNRETSEGIQSLKNFSDVLCQDSELACLIKVKITLIGGGNLEPCAMICLPHESDIVEKRKEGQNLKDSLIILQPSRADLKQEQRKKLRAEHVTIKRRLNSIKKKAKAQLENELNKLDAMQRARNFKKLTEEAENQVVMANKEIIAKHKLYNSDMEHLWLMNKEDPLQCCSRNIIGYLTHGCFSMTLGRAAGVGWVALKPLLECIHLNETLRGGGDPNEGGNQTNAERIYVLVRNPTSLQYCWGNLLIVK
ncbi:Ribonucleases P/MRP protein subunit pop1 [Halocaridina rubra]|uniref:Ribonucleases P/MRP protein subunit pop1 n=1 Tax=Halocaridina rubra TaxID=373956 RepID=A0AAN9A8E3_HALRR